MIYNSDNRQTGVLSMPPEALVGNVPDIAIPNIARVADIDPDQKNGNELLVVGNFKRLLIAKCQNEACTWPFISEELDNYTGSLAMGGC